MNLKSTPRFLLAPLAALLLATVAPADAKDGSCEFQAIGLALTFGTLDPSNAVQVVKVVQAANSNAGTAGDCDIKAGIMTVSVVGATARQLRNGSGATIPYTLAGFPLAMPQPGNNLYANVLSVGLTGTIAAGVYADAPAGSYSDTVTISVTP